ncbi:Uncharacterized protein BM_BM18186 [Brugia malayi]|uniref:Uncharacterized protein n=1 Tax=Brugia malayi TaxID=6279 RepID=A0A4E9F6J1_BRUMA|nr:Uncharacterized protein BM_BM18186 [Brugia malayi]VIO92389.1 Uncharacterized protein BM_BM18186 [Brugia malayi]
MPAMGLKSVQFLILHLTSLRGHRAVEIIEFFLSAPIVNSSHRQSFTSIDQITLAIQSRPSIVHAKPSQSRNFPFVQRSGDGIVMPACYSGQFQQITPIAAAAATTSGSIRGNVAMSGYNYYSMPAYYTTSVTQTTPAATTSGSIEEMRR